MNVVAEPPCTIHVVPADAGTPWRTAADDASQRLSRIPASERDCREVVVQVRNGRALVSVTTADGRRAARPVGEPGEVAPVIRALLATVPASGPPESAQREFAPAEAEEPKRPDLAAPPASSARPARVDAAPAALPATPTPGRWIVVLGGGGRLGMADWVGASPLTTLSLGFLAGALELGVSGSIDFTYSAVGSTNPPGFRLSTTSAGAFVGIRPQLVRGLRLTAGLSATATWVQEDVAPPDQMQGNNEISGNVVTYRPTRLGGGVYVGIVVPFATRLRLRPQAGVDSYAAAFGDSPVHGVAFPALPPVSVSLTFALEGCPL